jgi:hypothetical protein
MEHCTLPRNQITEYHGIFLIVFWPIAAAARYLTPVENDGFIATGRIGGFE